MAFGIECLILDEAEDFSRKPEGSEGNGAPVACFGLACFGVGYFGVLALKADLIRSTPADVGKRPAILNPALVA